VRRRWRDLGAVESATRGFNCKIELHVYRRKKHRRTFANWDSEFELSFRDETNLSLVKIPRSIGTSREFERNDHSSSSGEAADSTLPRGVFAMTLSTS
jgi:hypothetical protein